MLRTPPGFLTARAVSEFGVHRRGEVPLEVVEHPTVPRSSRRNCSGVSADGVFGSHTMTPAGSGPIGGAEPAGAGEVALVTAEGPIWRDFPQSLAQDGTGEDMRGGGAPARLADIAIDELLRS